MTPPDDLELRRLWQRGDAGLTPLPLAEVKRRAATFGDVVARRNRREYVAVAVVIVIFGVYAVLFPGLLLKLGSLLIMAGAAFVGWQLARRTSRPDPEAEIADIRSFYRARLVTEEHMLARVGRWYLAPLVPGLAAFLAGLVPAAHLGPLGFALLVLAHAVVFLGIWLLNRRAAARLRAQIARLDATQSYEGEI